MPLLQGNQLECVRGGRTIFSEIDFSLEAGGLMQVHGPNGSGKTSLLRMICGLGVPSQGEIRWNGAAIRTLHGDYFKKITYIGHLWGVKDELTALENMRVSSALAGVDITHRQAHEALLKMGLSGRELLPAKVLSQGQRRRVALARLMVSDTELWVLDEPLAALDTGAVKLVRELMEGHLKNGGMIVMTTHQEIAIASASVERLQLG